MGKTYRKEQQFKKAREREDIGHDKHIDHDHERAEQRRRLRDAQLHWQDGDDDDDLT